MDTNAIESFTKNFVKDYYTWQNEKDSIEQRVEKISHYLTEELQALNTDTVRVDIPTSSSVSGIDIWSVSPKNDSTYAVVYSVDQKKLRKIKIAKGSDPPIESYYIKII